MRLPKQLPCVERKRSKNGTVSGVVGVKAAQFVASPWVDLFYAIAQSVA
jgi:hypothetical protein